MAEYIDKSALYEKIAQLEELARNRYLETPSNSQCYSRYMAQLNECTAFKHLIADFPSADISPVRHGRWMDNEDYMFCSCCGMQWNYCDNYTQDFHYCPNCGCKMDLEGE